MEILKQLQKRNNLIRIFFIILIFFSNYKISFSKVFSDNLDLKGSFIQGGLLFGKTISKNKIIFNKKNIFVNKNGDFVLPLGRDEKLENLIEVDGKKKETHIIKISKRKYKIQKIDGLPKNKVTPNEKELKRIKKESKKIRESKSVFFDQTLYKSGFIWPLKGVITGEYGNQRILNGKPRRPHYGLDIAAKSGSKIFGKAISLYRIPQDLSAFIVTNITEQGMFIFVVAITLLILGFIMETLSLILIMMPIFSISIAAMNIDLIWFGIIFTLMIECALITPPVGLNIYVLQAIGKAKMSEIAKGVIPFVLIMLFTVFVVYLFPDLALYIPFKL